MEIMGECLVYSNLTLTFKGHPIQYKVGIGFKGTLRNGRIKGLDLNKERALLEKFCLNIRDREITSLIDNYRGMESLAIYFLDHFDCDFVEIEESGNEKIRIWKNR